MIKSRFLNFRGTSIDRRYVIGISHLERTDSSTEGLGWTELHFTLYLLGYSVLFATKRYHALNSTNEERVRDFKAFSAEYFVLRDFLMVKTSLLISFREWFLERSKPAVSDGDRVSRTDGAESV